MLKNHGLAYIFFILMIIPFYGSNSFRPYTQTMIFSKGTLSSVSGLEAKYDDHGIMMSVSHYENVEDDLRTRLISILCENCVEQSREGNDLYFKVRNPSLY